MCLAKRLAVIAIIASALLGASFGRALAVESRMLVYDPALRQYLSFAPEPAVVEDGFLAGEPLPPLGEPSGILGDDELVLEEGCEPLDPSWWGPEWARRFSVFAGVHGFKGPSDLGRNGNFGFHEGLNYGAPLFSLLGYDLGYQLGAQVTHSNFKGDQIFDGHSDARHQVFLTAGYFHRVMDWGIQSGAVFDYFHDDYYDKADLKQIRSETSLRLGDLREIGYWGAYNVGGDTVKISNWLTQPLKPEDLFALFYRRHFSGGGQGRLWAGMSGNGDVFFGAETTVPMGTNWSLENNFAYLLPKEGHGSGGQGEETWAVSIQLVWYPGRPSRCVFRDPYQPLLNVADNSVFMVERK
ncbi:MAG: DUF6666 family protein [Thermoguttaceae bacterium]